MKNAYYDINADTFTAATQNADMSVILNHFLDKLPAKSRVLDWGCGSGRDSRAMIKAGFAVVPTDLSKAMCEATASLTGLDVANEAFADLKAIDEFDGIWANASLLHVPSEELPSILALARRALRESGVLYCSFKQGAFEGERDGRFFNDMDEDKLAAIIAMVDGMRLDEIWITEDVRPERKGELWLNCLIS